MSVDSLRISLALNGNRVDLDVRPHHSLLEALRDQAGLTGTKECCSEGECGACTVLLNGRAVTSCLVLAAEADDAEVDDDRGSAVGGVLDRLQQAFLATGAVQCGFCIPGMIMSAKYLLMTNPSPTDRRDQGRPRRQSVPVRRLQPHHRGVAEAAKAQR